MSFQAFAKMIGVPLSPHMRKIERAMHGAEREIGVCVARGNDKTTTAALIGLHYLVTTPGASVTIGAASRDQARIAFERMRGFALHPAISEHLVIRHLELRGPEGGLLRVIPSDGDRAHGLSSGLYIADECWCWPDKGLIEAFQTGLIKRADAKLLCVSTAPSQIGTPWGRMRSRALAQANVRRRGVFTEARGQIHWLEWSAAADAPLDDYKLAARVNPASRFTPAVLREAHARCTELAYRQFHLNQAGVTISAWLPPGALQACQESAGADSEVTGRVWIGVDLEQQGERGNVAWTDGHTAAVWTGTGGGAVDLVRELSADHHVVEIALDRWRCQPLLAELEELGAPVIAWPLTDSRLIPASARLHDAIIGGKLVLQDSEELRAASARTTARQVRRGWRVDGPDTGLIVALAMALDASAVEEPVGTTILGWI